MAKTLAKLSMLDIANAVAKTSPALADLIALYDAAGTANKRMTLENLFKTIGLLGVDGSPDTGNDFLVSWDASASAPKRVSMAGFVGGGGGGIVGNGLSEGRLTLSSGVPLPTSNVTAATALHWTPFIGNRVSLFDGTSWVAIASGERSITLAGLPANTNHDVFGYKNGLNMDLELLAWTNDNTRATSLAKQDGVDVKAGDATRRYLGMIRTVASGQCEDSAGGSNTIGRRFVWNVANRRRRPFYITEPAEYWLYTTQTWRRVNNNPSIEGRFIVGLAEDPISFAALYGVYVSGSTWGYLGLAMDWSSGAPSATSQLNQFGGSNNTVGPQISHLLQVPSEGYHYVCPIERGDTGVFGYSAISTHSVGGLIGEVLA